MTVIDFNYTEDQIIYDASTATIEIVDNNPDEYEGDYRGVENGFIYNGTASSVFHVECLQDAAAKWFEGPDFDVYDATVAYGNGGILYGKSVKPRVLKLSCYYEEITNEQREQIRRWLHRNTSGKLLFMDKPFVYWNVTPTNVIPGKKYLDTAGLYSGTFEIEFTAYNPFGYLTRLANSGSEDDDANDYCDLIHENDMPTRPSVRSTTFNVYNPGREVCGLSITLSGTVDHAIEFLNTTNKTRCILQQLPANNLMLEINGDNGTIKTYVRGDRANADLGYAYHDRGYIALDPGMNTITIMEQTDGGSWNIPRTLNLTSIEIDYAPRIL